MPIFSRQAPAPRPLLAPPEPQPRRVGFKVFTAGYRPGEIESRAMECAREYFGPGWDLEITGDYVIDSARSRICPDAEIIVWAVPESAAVPVKAVSRAA
jgi:hypothetical protein